MSKEAWRVAPYSPENMHRLARLHVLALYAETGYTLRFSESGNEWDVHFENMPEERSLTRDSTLLEHPLGDAIKMLEEYMDDHYINYPIAGQTEILKEGFWFDPSSQEGFEYPHPKENTTPWLGKDYFLTALFKIEQVLIAENGIQDHNYPPVKAHRGTSRCRICDHSDSTIEFSLKGWNWPYGFKHYVEEHNVKPSDAFINFIRKLDPTKLIKTDLAILKGIRGEQ